jgi:histidine triad (HIT) family protein
MARDPDCIFCKIVAGEIPCIKLFEDEDTLAFMDINPVQPGHALIIPKEHFSDLYTVADEAISATARVARQVATALRTALMPGGINLLQCNGKAAAQSVFHFHMHVIPRAHGDNLAMNWEITPGDTAAIAELAETIKAELG